LGADSRRPKHEGTGPIDRATGQSTALDEVDVGVAKAVANGPISSDSRARDAIIDPELLHAFVDGLVVTAMEDHRITGAVVAVVTPTDTLMLKGYGMADAQADIAVDPAEHLFRIASITKTFTATAIMQLWERGLVDFDADIRTYLGEIAIDDHLGAITIADLITHSAGFEDRFFGYYGPPPAGEGTDIESQLAATAAIQVRKPGTVTSYSNYSFALLGEIIARVSGVSYADYLRDNILLPLGMESSDVRLKTTLGNSETPWLAELQRREARPHHWNQGWHDVLEPFVSRNTVHAEGGMSSTGADMARYLKMHLNQGAFGEVQILKADSWQRMSSPLFRNGLYSQANAHGFWTEDFSGYDALVHGGSINEFKSGFALIPELNLGFFVSTNTDSGGKLRAIPRRVVEYFFPANQRPLPQPPLDFKERASLYTGDYLGTRRNSERFDRIFTAFVGALTVSSTDEGYLVLARQGDSHRYVEVEEHIFESLEDRSRIQFKLDDERKVRWLVTASGSQAYEPRRFNESPITLLAPLTASVVMAIGILIAAVVSRFRPSSRPAKGKQRLAKAVLRIGSLLWLGIVAAFAVAISEYTESPVSLMAPFPSSTFVLLAYLLWAVALTTLISAVLLPAVWGESAGWFLKHKLAYSAAALLFLLGVVSLYQWNAFLILK
ncbi:MAG: serine hydrolase domain-containing protein, partial [Pseudomonadota bacterium]